jgi:hypothetical protein
MELGKNFSMGSAAPAVPALSQSPVPHHSQAQIGQANSPKGAQPVALMGQGVPQLGQSAPRMPMSPGSIPAQAPAPIPAPAPQPALAGPSLDGETHVIVVEGKAPNGKTYFAEYEAIFPRGTKIMGVTERFNG